MARLTLRSLAIEPTHELELGCCPAGAGDAEPADIVASEALANIRIRQHEHRPDEVPRDPATTDAFDVFVATHEPRVRRLAGRLLGWRGRADVDDVVQDVFLAALGHLERFRHEASVETWLTTVTLNRCRTHRRRQLFRWRWLRETIAGASGRSTRADYDAIAGADTTPLRDESRAAVRAAVQRLGAKDREVIVLYYLEEIPVAEIATLLDLTPNAVDVRLHRAKKRLREQLETLADSRLR